jgi:hypothetical protein
VSRIWRRKKAAKKAFI